MFKTKGFSSNNSLKRRAIIVDAPDLPPEECEFFITSVGVADTETAEIPEFQGLEFEVEDVFEDEAVVNSEEKTELSLTSVKGIGTGIAENFETQGVKTIEDLLRSDPKDLASKITGVSSKKIVEWQNQAKIIH